MTLVCDVCKRELPAGTQFCPQCGLEVVPEREQASQRPPLEVDVFDWDEDEGKPKDYSVSQKQRPDDKLEQLVEMLRGAEARLANGQVLEAAATLKSVGSKVASHAKIKALHARLLKIVEDRQRIVREKCQQLCDEHDAERLCALLAGPAANELEPEQISRIAIDAARTFFDSRLADEAHELLRLPPFRTLRDEALVAEHRELDQLVHRRRQWQHWRQSAAILGSVILVAIFFLCIVVWLAWNGSTKIALLLIAVVGSIAGAAVAFHAQIAVWIRTQLGDDGSEQGILELLRSRWNRRR